MKLNRRYVQLALEGSIPLLGYFLWNWSLYFILLFYFIDMLSDEIMVHVKSRKTARHHVEKANFRRWAILGTLSAVNLIVALFVTHFAMYFISEGIDFWEQAVAFWDYEELGIKQGYVLVPLLLLMSYTQYKMEFLLPAKFRTATMDSIWKGHIRALYVLIAFAGLCLGLSQFVVFPEIVYILGIVLFSSLYKLKWGNA